ncbi:MAG: family transcriptional regulator [Hyphomicrobiales bacterium]|nr:family transcriptional regulator [Hyphomicrobiales bacterium]
MGDIKSSIHQLDGSLLTPSKRAILETLIERGPQSRAAIAETLGLSRAALSGLSGELIEAGILREAETSHDSSRLGRPSILLELNADHGYFVGVSIEQVNCPMVLADLHGNVIAQLALPTAHEPEEFATIIADGLTKLLTNAKIARKNVLGLSVVLSGFVNHSQDICLQSAILGWHEVPLARMVEDKVGIPTSLENNANAAAVGEKLFGRGREAINFSVVTFGESIGCAHYIDGKLYRGHGGGAGELAHCTIEIDGVPCRCGKRGCLDTIASQHAVVAAAREAGLAATTPQQIEDLAKTGNPSAIRILHRAGHALGLAISHLIQLNNPERIVIASVNGTLGSLFRTVTGQAIDAYVLPQLGSMSDIRFDDVNEIFWARGAAAIAAHGYLVGAGSAKGKRDAA